MTALIDLLEEVERLDREATPGPWAAELDVFDHEESEIEATVAEEPFKGAMLAHIATGVMLDEDGHQESWEAARQSQALKDARLMARYRTLAPEIARAVRGLLRKT